MYNDYNPKHQLSQAQFKTIEDEAQSKTLKRITIHKAFNVRTIQNLLALGMERKALNIHQCATFLELQKDGEIEKITRSNFCRERLCSVCAWRRQARFLATTEPALRKIDLETSGKAQYIFITLTVRNCPGEALSACISNMLRAWDRLYKRKPFAAFALGAIRSLEITYNQITNTFHPHIHALVLVKNEYFEKCNIINQDRLSAIWQHCLNVDYLPIVDISSVREKNAGSSSRINAAIETMKYSLKTKDYGITPEITKTLYFALHGRRLISFSGVIAQARKELSFDDVFDDNLTDDIESNIEARKELYLFTAAGWKIIQE